MTTQTTPATGLSLNDSSGRQQLQATLSDYVTFLRRQPAVCGTPEQQEALIKHVAQGHDLIKLVSAERLKITRQLDQQKQLLLRRRIVDNHKELYEKYFPLADLIFEYHSQNLELKNIKNSFNLKIGKLVIAPLRFIKNLIKR